MTILMMVLAYSYSYPSTDDFDDGAGLLLLLPINKIITTFIALHSISPSPLIPITSV